MALALDGSGHSNQTSAAPTVTLTTSSADDYIALFITSNPGTVSSVAGGGLTWNLRSSINSGGNVLTYYYAIAATALTSTVITVNMSSSTFTTLDVFGISGADTGSPFDGSVVTATGTVAQITTTNANDIVIGAMITTDSAGAAYTQVPASVPADFQMVEYKIVSATQTALNVDTNGGASTLTIADAIKQASAAAFVPYNPWPQAAPILAQ